MYTKSLLTTMATSALCATMLLFTACDKDNDSNKPMLNKLTFDKTKVEVTEGMETELKVKNGTAPFKAMLSGDKTKQIADVTVKDRVITIKGKMAGTATLAVTDKKGDRGVISVVVNKPVGTLKLDKTSLTMEVGKTEVVKAQDGDGKYTAVAKDPKMVEVTVDRYAISVKALKSGKTDVEVKDGDNNLGIISITVK